MLPAAVGVAISPLPIVATVLILVDSRKHGNYVAYLVGFVAGVAGLGAILLLLAGGSGANEDGQPSHWVSCLKLVLGLGLIGLAAKQWRGRPRADADLVAPQWIGSSPIPWKFPHSSDVRDQFQRSSRSPDRAGNGVPRRGYGERSRRS
jgi:Sap-like sulfolipid-1-addressing protein